MKKILFFIAMTIGLNIIAVSQNAIPKPKNPMADYYNDYGAFAAEFGINEFQYTIYPEDVDGNPLDSTKLSFSVFTDFDEIYTFQAHYYYESSQNFSTYWADGVDRTEIPYLIFKEDPNFTIWTSPIYGSTDTTLNDGERLFLWRIGIQVYYTDNGMKSASDIVYVQYQPDPNYWPPGGGVFPKPVSVLGDVNDDGIVNISDITALIDYLLGNEVEKINKFNADIQDDASLNISDVTSLIDYVLN